MHRTNVFFALFSLLGCASALSIQPFTAKTCEKTTLSFTTGGPKETPPFEIAVISGDATNPTDAKNTLSFPVTKVSQAKYDWIVDVPAGTSIRLYVKAGISEGTGDAITVEAGSDTSCVSGSASSSSSSSVTAVTMVGTPLAFTLSSTSAQTTSAAVATTAAAATPVTVTKNVAAATNGSGAKSSSAESSASSSSVALPGVTSVTPNGAAPLDGGRIFATIGGTLMFVLGFMLV